MFGNMGKVQDGTQQILSFLKGKGFIEKVEVDTMMDTI